MNRSALAGCVALALTACGLQSEEELISDREIAQVQTARAELTVATPQPPPQPGAFHLRLTWGYLGGNFRAVNWVNWTGGLAVDSGTATLEHLVFFDRHDFTVPSSDPARVQWKSRTLPHFDGVVVKVSPGAATDVLHLQTASFSQDFDVATLAAGVEQRFDVGPAGHQLSVSAIPDLGCGGFAFGYQRAAHEGWLGFGGILTNESGQPQGVLRFRADAELVRARLLGRNGEVLAEGEGTLRGEHFEFSLGALGTVKGFFRAGAPRGSFQASLSCP